MDIKEQLIKEAKQFLAQHHLATLATIDASNKKPHATVVYYLCNPDYTLTCVVSKESQKAKNISMNQNIALVVVAEKEFKTLQIQGKAEIINDQDTRTQEIVTMYKKIQELDAAVWPLMKLHPTDVALIHITIEQFVFYRFQQDPNHVSGSKDEWNNISA